MKTHLLNALCGVLDYVAYPAGMLLVTPLVLEHRGPEEFGVLAIATAVVSTGAILASGFGDAGIQAIAAARAKDDRERVVNAVRAMMSIQVVLGGALGALVFVLSDSLGRHLVPGTDAQVRTCCIIALRCGGLLLSLRAVEAVCVSTQRSFECYGTAAGVSVAARLLGLASAGVLAVRGYSVAALLEAMACVQVLSVGLQLLAVARRIGPRALIPSARWVDVSAIVQEGKYTWAIAAAGVVFYYADRLLLGFSRGAGALVWYALCVQLTQPIYGITASGLHFLFPYFARIRESAEPMQLENAIRLAAAANVGLVLALSLVAAAAGPRVLWLLGRSSAGYSRELLPIVLTSVVLMSASVVPGYALIAMRKARQVAATLIAGALGMAVAMPVLLHTWGVEGLALARLLYGGACVLLYWPLFSAIRAAAQECADEASGGVWVQSMEGDA